MVSVLIFIDDSGDPGFKLDKGSTSFFVIAMVIFDDDLEAEKTAVAIKELRRELGFSDESEFRFFKCRHEVRMRFFATIQQFKFRIRCLVVDKKVIRSPQLKGDKNSFYAYFIKTALEHHGGTIHDAKVKIDGGGDRLFRRNFMTYLRRELNSTQTKVMEQCRFADSSSNVLIQAADMVAGSINRAQRSDKKDGKKYLKLLEKHIENIWYFK